MNSLHSRNFNSGSKLLWLSFLIVLFILFITPFQKALFNGQSFTFERPIFTFLLMGAILLFLTTIYAFLSKHSHNWWVPSIVWLIPLSYTVALYSPASMYSAKNLLYIHIIYAALFMWSYFFSKARWGAITLQYGILSSSAVVIIFGFLNWFGQVHYQDAVMIDRLTSVFQYPNSYAAYLMAILFGTLVLTIFSRRWNVAAIHALLLVPTLLSFVLTLSRGALVFIPIVLLLLLPFLSLTRQLLLFLYFGLTAISTLIILQPITDLGTKLREVTLQSSPFYGWAILFIATVGSAALIGLIHWLVRKHQVKFEAKLQFPFSRFILPTVSLLAGTIGFYFLFGNSGIQNLLPSEVQERLNTIDLQEQSVLERGIFYQDALKVIQDYPVFGAGGGAWAALYEQYQSNPYISRQAHNYFLQVAVETGMVGLIILLTFLISVYTLFIRSYVGIVKEGSSANSDSKAKSSIFFFIISISLLLHSVIDFNMTFVYFAALVFVCLGAQLFHIQTKPLKPIKYLSYGMKVFVGALCLLSVFVLVNSTRLLSGNYAYQETIAIINTSSNLQEILAPLDQAIQHTPDHPDYVVLKTELLNQVYGQTQEQKFYDESLELIQEIKKGEPHNRQVFFSEYNLYMASEKWDRALSLATEGISKYPWDESLYEKLIGLNYELGKMYEATGDSESARKYMDSATSHYQTARANMMALIRMPIMQYHVDIPFKVTDLMALPAGEIYFKLGEYEAAKQALSYGQKNDFSDMIQRQITRYYLATLAKLNQTDQKLYDDFVLIYPEEKDAIEALIQGN
ncbi:O-antigen ligase family protein [Paenibacillus sp. TRM 82003]|nr:O-antigen ligase family protein [Paenibacillus sp. TRM 82003]